MIRVKRGVTKRARHKKWLDMAKGYRGRASTCYRIAHERVERGLQHAFRHRKEFKREMRSLWISRISAAVREHGLTYSRFMNLFAKMDLGWDRKMLSECAIHNPSGFKAILDSASKLGG